MNIENKKEVLVKIASLLNKNGIKWAVGASMLLYFHNIVSEFDDIDLMVEEKDGEKAKELLLTIGKLMPPNPNVLYKTHHFYEFKIDGVDVDMMIGFVIAYEGKDIDCSFYENQIEGRVKLDDQDIPLHSLSLWEKYYSMMGRTNKVKMIEDYFLKKNNL